MKKASWVIDLEAFCFLYIYRMPLCKSINPIKGKPHNIIDHNSFKEGDPVSMG